MMKLGREDRRTIGGRSWRRGHGAEWLAALFLMAKGYQILAFRLPSRAGEIDILARRGRWLVVVEVKQRADLALAGQALAPAQLRRLVAAGEAVQRGRASLRALALRIDMVALAPGRFPRHIQGVGSDGAGGP
jgi:putative endonuclease